MRRMAPWKVLAISNQRAAEQTMMQIHGLLNSEVSDEDAQLEMADMRKRLELPEPVKRKRRKTNRKSPSPKIFKPNEEYLEYFAEGERPKRIYQMLIPETVRYYKFIECRRDEKCILWAIRKHWTNYSCRACPFAAEDNHSFQAVERLPIAE